MLFVERAVFGRRERHLRRRHQEVKIFPELLKELSLFSFLELVNLQPLAEHLQVLVFVAWKEYRSFQEMSVVVRFDFGQLLLGQAWN